MIDIRLKASKVRDTACSLHISPTTVLSELKEKAVVPALVSIALLCTLNPEKVTVGLEYTGEAEMVRERSWRMSLVVTKMPSFSNSKRCGRPSSSHTTIRITGAHKRVTSTLQSILQRHHPMLCQTFAYLIEIERMIPDQYSQHQGFAPRPHESTWAG
jgi:hypothetical protein